jgi:Carboxypeptidase regulatory-like domain
MTPRRSWRRRFTVHWHCCRLGIGVGAAVLAVLAHLVAATISEAADHDADGREAPVSISSLEDCRGVATGSVERVHVVGVRAPTRAVAMENARGELVNAGAIGGRVVSCSGPVAGVRVSVPGRAESALSGPSGAFELNDLPPGTVNLTVETPGQHVAIAGIQVVSGQMTNLGEINLTDLRTDQEHCGRCGARCPAGASCIYAACVCPAGLTLCNGGCSNLADLENCRACANRCVAWPNTIPQCGAEDCVFRCATGTEDCDGRRINGCETQIDRDENNCGACGIVCALGLRCVNARCQE